MTLGNAMHDINKCMHAVKIRDLITLNQKSFIATYMCNITIITGSVAMMPEMG